MKYREGDEAYCDLGCLQEGWSRQMKVRAEERGLCVNCWASHESTEPCVAWVRGKK